jgi:hypothetical protein
MRHSTLSSLVVIWSAFGKPSFNPIGRYTSEERTAFHPVECLVGS